MIVPQVVVIPSIVLHLYYVLIGHCIKACTASTEKLAFSAGLVMKKRLFEVPFYFIPDTGTVAAPIHVLMYRDTRSHYHFAPTPSRLRCACTSPTMSKSDLKKQQAEINSNTSPDVVGVKIAKDPPALDSGIKPSLTTTSGKLPTTGTSTVLDSLKVFHDVIAVHRYMSNKQALHRNINPASIFYPSQGERGGRAWSVKDETRPKYANELLDYQKPFEERDRNPSGVLVDFDLATRVPDRRKDNSRPPPDGPSSPSPAR